MPPALKAVGSPAHWSGSRGGRGREQEVGPPVLYQRPGRPEQGVRTGRFEGLHHPVRCQGCREAAHRLRARLRRLWRLVGLKDEETGGRSGDDQYKTRQSTDRTERPRVRLHQCYGRCGRYFPKFYLMARDRYTCILLPERYLCTWPVTTFIPTGAPVATVPPPSW